jgi:hypothetical protein
MIGDTPYDAEAALGAGTSAGGLLTGGFAREALEGAVFFVVARDLQDLLPCLESRSRHLAVVRGSANETGVSAPQRASSNTGVNRSHNDTGYRDEFTK